MAAPFEDSSIPGINVQPNELATDSGAVYVYVRNGSTWTRQAYLKGSYPAANATFGMQVALSADGNTLAATAFNDSSAMTGINVPPGSGVAYGSGAVYVFSRAGSTWTQQAHIKSANSEGSTASDATGDLFGSSVDISDDGNTLLVTALGENSGAPGINGDQNDNSIQDSGAAYVFARTAQAWAQVAYIKSDSPSLSGRFGIGSAISADGKVVAIASRANNGDVRVFTGAGAVWTQRSVLAPPQPHMGTDFGIALELSADGETLVIAARRDSSGASGIDGDPTYVFAFELSGAALTYRRAGDSWIQASYFKASNPGKNDVFGTGLALSNDANVLLVGSPFEGSSAIGTGGDQSNNDAPYSGAAYRFARTGAVWAQFAYLKSSDSSVAQDYFGDRVAISANGSTVVCGASAKDVGGPNAGAIYIYE